MEAKRRAEAEAEAEAREAYIRRNTRPLHTTVSAPPTDEKGIIYVVKGDGTYVPSNIRIPTGDKAWENVEKQTIEWLP